MAEPRYTREEWAVIEQQEQQESLRRARENGYGWVTIPFDGHNLRRMSPEARDSLIDAKLQQAKLSILKMLGDLDAGR
jgi:hypothetical protein